MLLARLADGDESVREEIIVGRIAYAKTLARQAARGRAQGHLDDLRGEAIATATEIILRFDPRANRDAANALALRIGYGVRGALWAYICRNVPAVSASTRTEARVRDCVEARARLREELGRAPTIEEVAERTGYLPVSVLRYLRRADAGDVPWEPWIEDHEVVADNRTPEASASDDDDDRAVRLVADKVVRLLRPRERGIVVRHFGLDGEPPASSVEQAGGKRNATVARTIRKRQAEALALAGRLLRVAACDDRPKATT